MRTDVAYVYVGIYIIRTYTQLMCLNYASLCANTHVGMYLINSVYLPNYQSIVGRDSSVGIATQYMLAGPGIEFRLGRDFPHFSRPAQPASCTQGIGSFQEVNRPRRGVDHPHTSSAEFKERVKLYLYPLSGFLWSVAG